MADDRKYTHVSGLRSPKRIELLQVHKVVDLCLRGVSIEKVLDVGCGSGIFAEAFAGRGLDVTGVDENAEMIAAARSFVPEAAFKPAPAEALPFRDKQFDLVFLGVVLHETDDPLAVLKESYRVSTGRVGVLEWPYEEQDYGPPLQHRLRKEYVLDLAKQAGFRHSRWHRLDRLVLYIMQV